MRYSPTMTASKQSAEPRAGPKPNYPSVICPSCEFRTSSRELAGAAEANQRLFVTGKNEEATMTKTITLAVLIGLSFASNALAECVVNVNRTACAGKESESYSKCGGSKSCDKDYPAATEAACIAAAKENCPNSRLEITKSKIVKARFNGKALKGPYGGNFCSQSRPDFNKCK